MKRFTGTLVFGLLAMLMLALLIVWRKRSLHDAGRAVSPPFSSEASAKEPSSPDGSPAEASFADQHAPLTDGDLETAVHLAAIYSAPIDFWGKVVDEFGLPVGGARITYYLAQRYFGEDLVLDGGKSDVKGEFSLRGQKGATLFVSASHDRYYPTPESSRSVGYGYPVVGPSPTATAPTVLVLHSRGKAEALRVSQGTIVLPRRGEAVEVSLRGEIPTVSPHGDLRLECRLEEANLGVSKPYDWRLRISVPNGGLVVREGTFHFDAPADGYQADFVFEMRRTDPRWISNWEGEFFLRLADGCFARARLRFAAGGDHFVLIESYLNPNSGHRSLEFDPNLVDSGQPAAAKSLP